MVTRGCIGRRVEVADYGPGRLEYFGPTTLGKGTWCGVMLEFRVGDSNGTIGNRRYFKCTENHGVFVPQRTVKLISESKTFSKPPSSATSKVPRTSSSGASSTVKKPSCTSSSNESSRIGASRTSGKAETVASQASDASVPSSETRRAMSDETAITTTAVGTVSSEVISPRVSLRESNKVLPKVPPLQLSPSTTIALLSGCESSPKVKRRTLPVAALPYRGSKDLTTGHTVESAPTSTNREAALEAEITALRRKLSTLSQGKMVGTDEIKSPKVSGPSSQVPSPENTKHLEAVKGQLNASERLCAALRAQKVDAESRHTAALAENEARHAATHEVQAAEIVALKAEIAQLQKHSKKGGATNVEHKPNEFESLKKSVLDSEKALQKSQEDTLVAHTQLRKLQEKLVKAETSADEARRNAQEFSSRVVIEQQKMVVLAKEHASEILHLQDEIAKAKAAVTHANSEKDRIVAEAAASAERSSSTSATERDMLSNKLAAAEAATADVARKFEASKRAASLDLDTAVNNVRKSAAEREAELKRNLKSAEMTTAQLTDRINVFTEGEKHLKAEIDELKQERDRNAALIKDLERSCQVANSTIAGLRVELSKLADVNSNANNEIGSLRAAFEGAKAEVEALTVGQKQSEESSSDSKQGWKGKAEGTQKELISLQHVLELRTSECKEFRVKALSLEEKLDAQRISASKTLSDVTRLKTQNEELTGTLESKRVAHEQAVVENAHLKDDLKSLEEDMKLLALDNSELRNQLQNYRKDLESSGIIDPFKRLSETPVGSPARPVTSSTPHSTAKGAQMFG